MAKKGIDKGKLITRIIAGAMAFLMVASFASACIYYLVNLIKA